MDLVLHEADIRSIEKITKFDIANQEIKLKKKILKSVHGESIGDIINYIMTHVLFLTDETFEINNWIHTLKKHSVYNYLTLCTVCQSDMKDMHLPIALKRELMNIITKFQNEGPNYFICLDQEIFYEAKSVLIYVHNSLITYKNMSYFYTSYIAYKIYHYYMTGDPESKNIITLNYIVDKIISFISMIVSNMSDEALEDIMCHRMTTNENDEYRIDYELFGHILAVVILEPRFDFGIIDYLTYARVSRLAYVQINNFANKKATIYNKLKNNYL